MTVPIEDGYGQVSILLAAELVVKTAFFLLLAGLAGLYDLAHLAHLAKALPQRAVKKQGDRL
jgi:hypothetical protein